MKKNDLKRRHRCKADQWRIDHDLSVSAMARAINVSQPDLHRVFLPIEHSNWREASLTMRKKMRDFTGGAVGLSDWPEKPLPARQHENTQQTGAA